MRNWLLKKITRERLSTFLERHATDERVLEIGASFKPQRALFTHEVAGDIAFHPALDTQFDAHHLPFADQSFARIVCIEVLEHCHNPQRVLDECYRVLQPDGLLILTTRFVFPLHDTPHDYFRYTKYGLQHLCRHFSHVTVQPETGTVETMAVLSQRMAYQVDWRIPMVKLVLLLLAKMLRVFKGAIRQEYGDIRKDASERDILASGYYLVARR